MNVDDVITKDELYKLYRDLIILHNKVMGCDEKPLPAETDVEKLCDHVINLVEKMKTEDEV